MYSFIIKLRKSVRAFKMARLLEACRVDILLTKLYKMVVECDNAVFCLGCDVTY